METPAIAERFEELLAQVADLLDPQPARYVVASESTIWSERSPNYVIGYTDDPKAAVDAVARLTPRAVPCEKFTAREAPVSVSKVPPVVGFVDALGYLWCPTCAYLRPPVGLEAVRAYSLEVAGESCHGCGARVGGVSVGA